MEDLKKVRKSDRYMPCLFSRLCDDNPHNPVEHFQRGISVQQLKEMILRNIELILNSRSRPSAAELDNDSEIRDSVLGMGLEDFCGCSHSLERRQQLLDSIRHQICTFEPRLAPDSVEIRLIDTVFASSALEIEIRGRICAAELDAEEIFCSFFELETGVVNVGMKK